MARTAPKKSAEAQEAEIVSRASAANALAELTFGAQSNLYGVQEIYDYLEDDASTFKADLDHVVEQACKVFNTTAPTPEQVFWLFEEIFDI